MCHLRKTRSRSNSLTILALLHRLFKKKFSAAFLFAQSTAPHEGTLGQTLRPRTRLRAQGHAPRGGSGKRSPARGIRGTDTRSGMRRTDRGRGARNGGWRGRRGLGRATRVGARGNMAGVSRETPAGSGCAARRWGRAQNRRFFSRERTALHDHGAPSRCARTEEPDVFPARVQLCVAAGPSSPQLPSAEATAIMQS